MLPTYQLELDVAGMSNALEVASQVGMEESVVRARVFGGQRCFDHCSAESWRERERLLEELKEQAELEKAKACPRARSS